MEWTTILGLVVGYVILCVPVWCLCAINEREED